jgi:YbgC/YbaW family acyl-CoA thioester hydrolase
MHSCGILFAVVSIHVDYRAPARLDDELEITCEPRPEGSASLRFAQHIYRRSAAVARPGLLVDADVRVACVDARSLRPKRLPQFLLDAVAAEAQRG